MSKVTLLAEKLWLIRSTKTKPDGAVEVRYYETVPAWNKSPMEATLFQNYDAAEAHMGMVTYNFAKHADKMVDKVSKEVFDIVSLHTEIIHSPNGVHIKIEKD